METTKHLSSDMISQNARRNILKDWNVTLKLVQYTKNK